MFRWVTNSTGEHRERKLFTQSTWHHFHQRDLNERDDFNTGCPNKLVSNCYLCQIIFLSSNVEVLLKLKRKWEVQKRESFTALGPLETTFHQRSIIKLSSSSSQCFMRGIKASLKTLGLLAFPQPLYEHHYNYMET